MGQIAVNNASGLVHTGIDDTATQVNLFSAAAFAIPNVGQWYYATFVERNPDGAELDWEVVKITAVVSNTITMVRGQDGTAARAWPSGTLLEPRFNAASLHPPTNNLDEIGAALTDADSLAGYDDSASKLVRATLSRVWTYIQGKLGTAATTSASDYATAAHDHAGVYEPADVNLVKKTAANTWSALQTFLGLRETVNSTAITALSPSAGTIVYRTLSAATTFTDGLASGDSITLHLVGGATHDVTWPTITWVGGEAPTLTASDVLVLWKVSTTLYGQYVGSTA